MEKCGRTCSPLWIGGGLRKGRGVVASAPSFFGSYSVIGMVVPMCTSLWQVTAEEYGTASLLLGETTLVGLSCKREMDKFITGMLSGMEGRDNGSVYDTADTRNGSIGDFKIF